MVMYDTMYSMPKYTKELLEEAVQNSISYAGVLRYLGIKQAGGSHTYIAKQIRQFNIDTSHFLGQGHRKGVRSSTKLPPEKILVRLEEGSPRTRRSLLLRAMMESGVDYVCAECYNGGSWGGKSLTLEIDHIDGEWLNNTLNNLRFLCPNCHSQQQTSKSWKSKPA